jgi:hypothetical protein
MPCVGVALLYYMGLPEPQMQSVSGVSRFFLLNNMISNSITIRLELTPQDALLLAFVIGQGLTTAVSQKIISSKGVEMIETAAQSIVNQIQSKTDFDQLRTQNDLLGGLDSN